ncbi:MFS transporter [Nocardia spumae]|uniref:MFS transporter n=1 Tax=Nocardia spumae TaxID=2887190 RepID=UPI001D15C4E8|nr:MFS transporter [Nocardia spumae]
MRFSPLRHAGFRWFFFGQTVSLSGSAMAPVAVAFAVLDASGSIGQLGVVLVARTVPMLAFLLIGGAMADRYSRRTVLLVTNAGSALTQGSVAVLLLTGHYWLPAVALLECGNGVLAAFTTPALRGVVSDLVDKSQLRQANSLLGMARNATKILGPGAAGVIVATVGSGAAIAGDAASFLAAAVCLARLPLATPVTSAARSLLAEIGEGWAQFRSTPWIWTVTVAFFVVNLVLTGSWQILGPALTKHLSGEQLWGFVLSARGLGMLLMSALMSRLLMGHLLRFGLLMGVLSALPMIALGAHLAPSWLIIAAFVGGAGMSALAISWDTSLQEHVPEHTISRVSSYDNLLSYAAIPIGQSCIGPLSGTLGGFHVALVTGILAAAAALAPLASTAVRRLPHALPERSPSEPTPITS